MKDIFKPKKQDYKFANLVIETHIKPKKRSYVFHDIPENFGHGGGDEMEIDDPKLISISSTDSLRKLGYLLVHLIGDGVDGGRLNYYQVGWSKDPWARENAIGNIPDFIKLKYLPRGDRSARFYFWQKSITGEWEFLDSSNVDMPILLP